MPRATGDRFHERVLLLVVGAAALFLGSPLLQNLYPHPTADTPIVFYLALFVVLSLVLLVGGLHLIFRALGIRAGPLGRRLEDPGSMLLTERLHLANVLVVLGLGVLTVQTVGEWFPFNLGIALAIVYVVTPLHELGHVLLGLATGHRILLFRTGGIVEVPRFRFAGADVTLGFPPSGGMVVGALSPRSSSRARSMLFTAGGILVNAGLLVVGLVYREPDMDTGFAPFFDLAAANALVLATNLVPRLVRTPLGQSASDGMALVQLSQAPDGDFNSVPVLAWSTLVFDRLHSHDADGAQRAIDEAELLYPAHPLLDFPRGNLELAADRPAKARERFLAAMDAPSLPLPLAAGILNNVAWCDALIGDEELKDEADAYSAEALGFFAAASLKGTRGFVLSWLGRHEEGLTLMREAFATEPTATGGCGLALGYFWAGQRDEAELALARARDLDSRCELLPRLDAVLRHEPRLPPGCDGESGS